MQRHFAHYTKKLDLGLAIFQLGLYVGIDLHTVYVCLCHLIRSALDRALRPSGAHVVLTANIVQQMT